MWWKYKARKNGDNAARQNNHCDDPSSTVKLGARSKDLSKMVPLFLGIIGSKPLNWYRFRTVQLEGFHSMRHDIDDTSSRTRPLVSSGEVRTELIG